MDGWRIALWIAVGYIAVSTLVRMMLNRRNEAYAEVQQQIVEQWNAQQASKPAEREAA